MLAFAFLNPLLLWGIPLAAVPIVIHLLNRRRFQRVPWAAMEYLLAAMKRNRKRMRMEQWLVLLLRTLAVLLLVMLVARPQLAGGGLIGARTHHVVLLDDSASMGQRSGSASLHDKARDQIRQLAVQLASNHDGDLFSLVRLGKPGTPDLWAQRIGPDLANRVGTMLKELPPGDGAVDLGAALTATHQRALATKEAGRTEYLLVSDARATDWIGEDDKPRPAVVAALSAMDAKTAHLTLIAVGSRDADNLAVVAIRRLGRLTAVGVSLEYAVDVQNFGLDASQATELAVEVDGKSRVTQPVPQLAPGERVAVPITHTFHAPGFHRVEALLPATDHYPLDDRRTLALPVPEKSKVLLVDGEPGETAEDGETRFLQVALDQGGEVATGIEPQVITDATLAETDLAPFDFIWLCNVSAPSSAVVEKLEKFAASGGGIGIHLGAQVDPTRYNDVFWRKGQGLLPLALGEIQGDPDKPDHLFLVDKNHPLCGRAGEGLGVFMGVAVLVKRYLTMVDDPKAGVAVMARVRDAEGSPAIVTKTFGSGGGQVMVFAFSADDHWSNWPKTPANLVVAQESQRFGARAQDLSGFNLGTAGAWRIALDPGVYKADVRVRALAGSDEEYTLTAVEPKAAKPDAPKDGKPGEKPADAPTDPNAKPADAAPAQIAAELPMADLRALGAYEVELTQHSGSTEKRLFARNAPIEESRLVRFLEGDFRRAFPPEVQEKLTFRDESAGLGSNQGQGEMWRALAAAMLIALLLETVLAWRFGRR